MSASAFHFPLAQLGNFPPTVSVQGFKPSELETIRELWDDNLADAATLNNGNAHYVGNARHSRVIHILPTKAHVWLYERLSALAIDNNRQHYQFELAGIHEAIQLLDYGPGDQFSWHMDFGPSTSSNRKLGFSVQLSEPDDYQGGSLQFRVSEKITTAPRAKGTVSIFPAFLLHRVTPITAGHRRTLVGWISGPPFR